MTLENLQKLFI